MMLNIFLGILCLLFLSMNNLQASFHYGGHVRQRVTHFADHIYSEDLGDLIYTHRYHLKFEKKLSQSKIVAEFAASFMNADTHTRPTIEHNELAQHQLFYEYSFDKNIIKLGRQELRLGKQRLVAVRDGPNVRRRFDGVYYERRNENSQIKLFHLYEVIPQSYTFDDKFTNDRSLSGIYATYLFWNQKLLVSPYLLRTRFKERQYLQASGEEKRFTSGVLGEYVLDRYTFELEGIFQWGDLNSETQGNYSIKAFSLAFDLSYHFEEDGIIGVRFAYASGDDQSDDRSVGTFSGLFPRGNYFDEVAVVGPSNFYNYSPYISYTLSDEWEFGHNVDFFFRAETSDTVYSPPGGLLVRNPQSRSRRVHTGFSSLVNHDLNKQLSLTLVYSYIDAKDFLIESLNAKDIHFVEATLKYRF